MSVLPYGCVVNLCESSHGVHSSTPRQLLVERHVNRNLQDMILELKRGEPHASTIAKCRLLEALVWICRGEERQWTTSAPAAPDAPADVPEQQRSVAGRCRTFIEAHFDRSLDLDSLAQAVCTNKSNLCRVFRNETGMTVGEYLTRIRIDAAKRLLLTSLTVSAVAKLVGFEDPYYFSRVFRRATAASPSEFRTQMGAADCHSTANSRFTVESV
jgi:AraC-like DNA-binding protein